MSSPLAPSADMVLSVLLAASPFAQVLFEVGAGGELICVRATRAAYRSGLLLADEIEGRPLDEVLRAESAWSLRKGFNEAIRCGEPDSYEEFLKIGGRETWWMSTVTPIFDELGVPAYVLVSFSELELLRGIEAALRRSESRFKRLVEAISDPIFVLRADGCVVYASSAAAKLLGYGDRRDLVDRPIEELVRPVDPSLSPIAARGEEQTSLEALVVARDGTIANVEFLVLSLCHEEPTTLLIARERRAT